jgi:hypothetical protein
MKIGYKAIRHLIILYALVFPSVVCAQTKPSDFLAKNQVLSLAIFPSFGETVPSNVRSETSASLVAELQKQVPALKLATSEEVSQRMEKAGTLSDFAEFLNLFSKTGMVSKVPLARMGAAAGADAILLIDVQHFESLGNSVIRTRTGRNSIRIQYTLFFRSGEQVWQSVEGYSHSSLTIFNTDTMERTVKKVSEEAVKDLLRGEQRSNPKYK